MHPLDGPRLKVGRAISEIETLSQAETAFRQEADYRVIRAELNPKTGQCVYRIRAKIQPPLEWGVWIGEVAHNLRSALDGLVYQLALLNGARASTRITQFPVFLHPYTRKIQGRTVNGFHASKNKPRQGMGARMISLLKPDHQAIIERLQPYKRGKGGRMSPLFQLSELNNADKHRLIQVIGVKVGVGPFVGWWIERSNATYPFVLPRRILKDGPKLIPS